MLHSDYRALVDVALPFLARQKYMHSFDIACPVMADGFEDYLPIVTSLFVVGWYLGGYRAHDGGREGG